MIAIHHTTSNLAALRNCLASYNYIWTFQLLSLKPQETIFVFVLHVRTHGHDTYLQRLAESQASGKTLVLSSKQHEISIHWKQHRCSLPNSKLYTTEPCPGPHKFCEPRFTTVPSIYALASLSDIYLSYFSQKIMYTFLVFARRSKRSASLNIRSFISLIIDDGKHDL